MEFNLIGPSYVDATRPISYQDTINWIPERIEAEGRVIAALRTPAGLETFEEVVQTGCRGAIKFQDSLYTVYGTKLYRVSSGGVGTDLGTVGGTGPVSMCQNASQLVIATGSVAYVYDGSTLASISGLNNPNTCAFLDQYIIFDGDGGQFQISALNDASSIDALDFATAEAAPDDTVAVLVDHQELLLFGTETIEPWVNTGAPDFPFSRTQGSLIERGTESPHTVKKVDNTVYWLDNLGMVQAMAGHNPQRISTHAIEQEISNYMDQMDEFFAWGYVENGHWFYVLQCPDLGKTFVYDASIQQWHRRKSYGENCWRARHYAKVYGKHIVGDYASGNIWDMRQGVFVEGSDPMVSERYTYYAHGEDQPVFNHSLWLKFDTGQGLSSGQGSNPLVDVRWSDDGGRNFSNYWQRSIGQIGQYNKDVRLHGMGHFKDRMFHIRVADPVKRDLLTAYIRPTRGTDA